MTGPTIRNNFILSRVLLTALFDQTRALHLKFIRVKFYFTSRIYFSSLFLLFFFFSLIVIVILRVNVLTLL
jgi:hypothetical protein